jgi:hypothetical protein
MTGRVEREMVLLLAYVSGYTRYMVENRTAALHSQGIITDLLEAVISQVEIPLEVSKLEGDAVFMFAERPEEGDWQAICQRLGGRLKSFVDAFDAKLAELAAALACPCAACRNLDKLRLKVVAHAGRAVRHRVGRFEELTGVDVILVHRLLKNRVQGNSYLLLTEPAFMELRPPDAERYEVTSLEDKDLGVVALRVQLLEPLQASTPPAGLGAQARTMVRELRWRWRAWRSS